MIKVFDLSPNLISRITLRLPTLLPPFHLRPLSTAALSHQVLNVFAPTSPQHHESPRRKHKCQPPQHNGGKLKSSLALPGKTLLHPHREQVATPVVLDLGSDPAGFVVHVASLVIEDHRVPRVAGPHDAH